MTETQPDSLALAESTIKPPARRVPPLCAVNRLPVSQLNPKDARYYELVDKNAALLNTDSCSLPFYHALGASVAAITQHGPDAFGPRTVEDYAKHLRERSGHSLTLDTLYKACRFYDHADESMLNRCIALRLNWRQVNHIFANKVPSNVQRTIIGELERGWLRASGIKKAIREMVPSLASRKSKSTGPAVEAERFSGGAFVFRDIALVSVDRMLDKLNSMEPDQRAAFAEPMRHSMLELQLVINASQNRLSKLQALTR